MAVTSRLMMHYMTVVGHSLIYGSSEYESIQILKHNSDSICLGEIRKLQSPYLPIWSVESAFSVNRDKTWLSIMNFLCELTVLIDLLPVLVSIPKTVSSTFELLDSVTSDFVNLFKFAMCTIASKCFPIELVPLSDGWWRTWWQTIHMMPGQAVSWFLQRKLSRH